MKIYVFPMRGVALIFCFPKWGFFFGRITMFSGGFDV